MASSDPSPPIAADSPPENPTLQRANPGTRPGGIPPSRSNLSTTANRLIAEYTLARTENNLETDLVYVRIKSDMLYSTYANTLKPIVFGNFRNIGARTVTDNADTTFLNNVVTTVATNAVICTYAVAFNKAAKLDAGAVTRFGNFNPVDTNRFPALTTHLIASFGPYEASHLPYKCTFIPYITWNDVRALTQQAGYVTHFYESFLQAMKRGRTVAMADVNVNEVTSSSWWTLFMDNIRPTTTGAVTTPGSITAYNPASFDDRDTAVILGSMVIEDTLYDLPGPVIVTTIGPFASIHEPTSYRDIPPAFRTGNHVNIHVPAVYIRFDKVEQLNHSSALALGNYQDNDEIMDLSDLPTEDTKLAATSQTTKKTKTSKTTARTTRSTTDVNDSLEDVGNSDEGLYTATALYFDHVLADRVPHLRRSNVVTDANKSE